MKRFLILTTIMLLVLALSVSAEEAAKKNMHFGITGGLSLANWTGSDATPPAGVTKKMRVGFAGGVLIDFVAGPSFQIQPELLYVQKGAKYESSGVTATAKFDYLEVPVLVKWVPVMEGKIQPTIFAGPYLGFLMSAKEADVDVKDSAKKIDFGIAFGAGFGAKTESGELFFDVRVDLGLSKIDDHTPQANIKNTAFLAMVGYRFGK